MLVDFVFDKNLGPQSRVGREYESHKRGRKQVQQMLKKKTDFVEDELDQQLTFVQELSKKTFLQELKSE